MSEGILLVCDDFIELSKEVKLIQIDDSWQLYCNEKLDDVKWERAMIICKGFGALINAVKYEYRVIWENGDYEDIKIDMVEERWLSKLTEFIVDRVGLSGFSDRALVKNEDKIEDKGSYLGRIELNVFLSEDGCPVYVYEAFGSLYYGILNKEKTQWLIDIRCGYTKVEYDVSGVMIFRYTCYKQGRQFNKTHLVYKQENIVEPFLGKLERLDRDTNLYRYSCDRNDYREYLGEGEQLKVDGVTYESQCLVRVTTSGIEVIEKFPKHRSYIWDDIKDEAYRVYYFSNDFILWGANCEGEKVEDYLLAKGTVMLSEYNFCGYMLDYEGRFNFNGNELIIPLERNLSKEVRDIVAYYNDNGTMRGVIITPRRGFIEIGAYDIVYREDNGWLKIIDDEHNKKRFYYGGKIYKDMRSAYVKCEKVKLKNLLGKSIYVCQGLEGKWTLAAQDMEPIGIRIRGDRWHDLKSDAIEEAKQMLWLDNSNYYTRKRIGIGRNIEGYR